MLSQLPSAALLPGDTLCLSPSLFTPTPTDTDEQMLSCSAGERRSVSVIPGSCPVSDASSQSSDYLSLPSLSPPPPWEEDATGRDSADSEGKVYSLCNEQTASLLKDELLKDFYRRTEKEKRADEEMDEDDSVHSEFAAFDHNISSAELPASAQRGHSASPAPFLMEEDALQTPPPTSTKTPKSRSAGHVEKRREPVDAGWIRLDPLLTRKRPVRPKKRGPAPIGMTLGRKKTLFLD